jgi:hypothetical protein
MSSHITIVDPLNYIKKNLAVLLDWKQRTNLFSEFILEISPEKTSTMFQALCIEAAIVKSTESVVALHSAFIALLNGQWDMEHLIHTREAAAGQKEKLTLALLHEPPFFKDISEDEPIEFKQDSRPLTLGERKAMAAIPSRKNIERAMEDPHPAVARKLLENPKVTQRDIIRIAASVKMSDSSLAAICRHPRWRVQKEVQRALINNKNLPVEFAFSLIPFVSLITLREVSFDKRLSQELMDGAFLMIELMSKNM